jgi:hypothetical protein
MNKKVVYTHMIYKLDMLNTQTNFHNYIDYHPNIVLIIKTNSNIFGAFTTAHYDP